MTKTPFRQLHPTLKKCNCGFTSTKQGFLNHMEAKERLAIFLRQTDVFWKDHGEVPIYEDEVTFEHAMTGRITTRTQKLAMLILLLASSAFAQNLNQVSVDASVARSQSYNGGPSVYGVTPYYYPCINSSVNDTINQANVMNASLAASGYANQVKINKISNSIEENIQWLKKFRDAR